MTSILGIALRPRRRTTTAVLAIVAVGVIASCGSGDSSSGSSLEPVPNDISSNEPVISEPAAIATADTEPVSTEPQATEPTPDVDEYGPPTVELEFDDRTLPVEEPLVDGIYYSQETISDGTMVTFVLGQWFKCDKGVADEPSVLCASGFGTLDEPSVRVALVSDAMVTINTGDLSDFAQADVSAGEFARLANDEVPSAGAPDFTFFDFPTFVRVQDGEVIEAEQIYTS